MQVMQNASDRCLIIVQIVLLVTLVMMTTYVITRISHQMMI